MLCVYTFTVGPPVPPHVDGGRVGGGAGLGGGAGRRDQGLLGRGVGQLAVARAPGSSQRRASILRRATHLETAMTGKLRQEIINYIFDGRWFVLVFVCLDQWFSNYFMWWNAKLTLTSSRTHI